MHLQFESLSKATTDAERLQLEVVLAAADDFDKAELRLPETIAAHRAKRGAAKEKVSDQARRMLVGFTNDLKTLEEETLKGLAVLESARSVVVSLQLALEYDIKSAAAMLKHYPALDRPIGETHLELKSGLLAAFDAFLHSETYTNAS